MRARFQSFLNPETPLRERMFQLLSVIALAEFLVVSVYTIVSDGSAGHIALMLGGTALFAVTVSLTFKTGKMRTGAVVSGLLYFLMYPLTFFQSGGLYGGAPAVFAFALIYVYLITQSWERVAALSACILGSAVCYLLSYRHPALLTRHSFGEEHIESLLSVWLVTLLLCSLFAFVTEVYRAENRIVQKQKKEIEELNRAQKRFFASMSHEIRTPVNAIIGLNEMNLRGELSAEARENAENIEVASRTLLHTVNEILDMSLLETGGMTILSAPYRTSELLSDIAGMTRQRAQEKGLVFRTEPDPALPVSLRGDEQRIKQVLLNLVSNAVKYTKTGSVTLALRGETRPDGSFWLCCTVTDTGIGIRPESLPQLFDAFQRADEQETHAIEGTGLGLSIVRQLVDRMGGTVDVESEYGRGSRFTVSLPQEIVDASPLGSAAPAHSPGKARPDKHIKAPSLRVLAVDDTPMNLLVVKKLLRDTEATVDTAASGEEALEMTARTRYDLILMDHQMPGMDGVACLRRLRAQENGLCRESRVVCLTANVGAEIEALYREAGFDGYLVKPVRGKTLEDELARLCPDRIALT